MGWGGGRELAGVPAETAAQAHIHETLVAPAVRDRAYQTVLRAYKCAQPPSRARGRGAGSAAAAATACSKAERGAEK